MMTSPRCLFALWVLAAGNIGEPWYLGEESEMVQL